MDAQPGEAVLQHHREALRTLNRRELQARAKALGVRANGKSADIINSVARVLSRPGSPVKVADSDKQAESDNDGDDHENGKPSCDAAVLRELSRAAGDVQQPWYTSGPSAMDCLHDCSQDSEELSQKVAPSAVILPATSAGPARSARPVFPTTGSSSNPITAHVPVSTPGSVNREILENLAARASAAALAASLENLRFQSQLKGAVLEPASLRQDIHQLPAWESSRCSGEACSHQTARSDEASLPVKVPQPELECQQDELTTPNPAADRQAASADPARRVAFVSRLFPLHDKTPGRAPSSASDQQGRSPMEVRSEDFAAIIEVGPLRSGQTCNGLVGGNNVSVGATVAQFSLQSADFDCGTNSSRAAALSPVEFSGAPQLAFTGVPTAISAEVTTPSVSSQVAVPARRPGIFVTERTLDRQHRFMAALLQPLAQATTTPLGRGAAPPRTPGTGLRTPARRVPVCSDDTKERAMDLWVTQHLLIPGGRPITTAGLSWGQLVGMEDTKQRLQATCMDNAATNEVSTPPAVAQARPVGAASSMTASAGKDTARSEGITWTTASMQPRPARPCSLPNAAVLVVGPSGIGKGHLARALTSELGAAYVHVPPDLLRRVAQEPGGADVVMRSVSRVATQLPGPVVVHVEDVDKLAGIDLTRQSQECRRLRTELLVAVDELLLQPPAKMPSPAQRSARGASPASSSGRGVQAGEARASTGGNGSACKARFKVLVLTTTSRPMDLDAALAASLGRTERILAAPPGPEDRELYLVERLASEGAALGVAQVEHIVRQTEGFSGIQLVALCDGAIDAAAARRASREAHGPPLLTEEDVRAALQQMGQPCAAGALAELEEWCMRTCATQNRSQMGTQGLA